MEKGYYAINNTAVGKRYIGVAIHNKNGKGLLPIVWIYIHVIDYSRNPQ